MKQVAVIIKSTCCALQHHHFLQGASAISSFHCVFVGTATDATAFPTALPFLQREWIGCSQSTQQNNLPAQQFLI